jgi:hypothetical protein
MSQSCHCTVYLHHIMHYWYITKPTLAHTFRSAGHRLLGAPHQQPEDDFS